ncbi:hypothetical protein NMG60_11001181 [Bertholletia excelsa]
MAKLSFDLFAVFVLVFAIALPSSQAQSMAPSPAPDSDGTCIDQGVAYVLMLVALILTYLIHTFDAPMNF